MVVEVVAEEDLGRGYGTIPTMKRLQHITPFIVMDILKEASNFKDMIHFEIGQPDLSPSPKVQEALQKAVQQKRFSYTQTEGLEILRQKIVKYYKDFYDVTVEAERIILTPGSSGAFLLAYALTLDIGQKLGFSDPGYPSYKNFAYILGIEPQPINVYADTNYCITTKHLQNLSIDALQISSPANPTGNIYDENNLEELVNYCQKRGIAFISDELYQGLVYEKSAVSALAFSDKVFVVNGFSKFFCMPGFRLGWIVVPKKYMRKATEIAQNLFIAPPTLSQYAALEAFDYEYLEFVRSTFQKRRDFLYNALQNLFNIKKPEGAFYLWADSSQYAKDSFALSKEILQKAHVAVTPGVDFGKNSTQKFLRFAFTSDIATMQEGVKRLYALFG